MSADALPATFTEAEAARKLGISKALLMRERAKGRVHPMRYGRRVIRYTDEILDEYLNSSGDSITEIMATAQRLKMRSNKRPGVYLLYQGDEVVCVGKTTHFALRLASHLGSKKFDHFSFVPLSADKIDSVERGLIAHLKPRLNIAMNPNAYTSRRTR